MAKRTLTNPQGMTKAAQTEVAEIYGKRQPKRPHYLRAWMERRHIDSQAELAKQIGADKSVVSRWLDEDNPTTPGTDWQARLGALFGGEGDPVDIFRHPDDDWFSRMVRNNNEEQVRRAIQILEAAGITPEGNSPPKRASGRG